MRTSQEETFEQAANAFERPEEGPSQLLSAPATRRKFLGRLLVATAGTVSVAGFSRPRMARAASGTTVTPNGRVLGPILAPDGFPRASIQGTLVGTRGAYCMVNTGESVVPVTVLPSTQVLGRGALWNGATSALSVGDRVFIFTTIVESGERVAIKVEQNPRLYDLTVSSITGSEITGTTLPSDATPGLSLQLTVNALTQFQQSGAPQVGSNIRVATISDSNVSEIIAMNVITLS